MFDSVMSGICMKKRYLQDKKMEWIVFFIFAVVYIVISSFHEPWFDEAQAWQIAKGPSLKEILFVIPHYEGHPPLWYLILMIPARLGIPFEIGLKTIGFLISAASVWLLLFRSRMPRIVRIMVPFSFFFFYQYGIIIRPYGLMLFLLLLLGQCFLTRKEHPWHILFILMLLCAASAYGIVISGGIALGMLWELFQEKGIGRFFRELFSDARTLSLIILLLWAIFLILDILPREDTWVTSSNGSNSFFVCLLCTLFTFHADCLLTNNIWFRTDTVLLQNATIPWGNLLSACVVGFFLWVLIVSCGRKKDLKFLIIPYFLFSAFSAAVYVGAHHLGIALLIILFWLEMEAGSEEIFASGRSLLEKIARNKKERQLLSKAAGMFALACLLVPIFWTISASVNDIRLKYSYGRSASAFLKENGMEDLVFLSSYGEYSSKNYAEHIGHEDYLNTYENGLPVLICAYLNRNNFINLNNGRDDEGYMHYQMAGYEKSKHELEKWESEGIPDALLGNPELKPIYGDTLNIQDFSLVVVEEVNYIWKTDIYHGIVPIFLRNDLLDVFGLEKITDLKYDAMFMGIPTVSKEIRERYQNGESIEDILKPYLDAMFGEES